MAVTPQLATGATTEIPGTTSRRAILGAGLGALIATVASALGWTAEDAARGADGDPVLAGQAVVASAPTEHHERPQVKSTNVFIAQSQDGTALFGGSTNPFGVAGFSKNNVGVRGQSTNGDAVQGIATTTNGVKGTSESGIGVQGRSNTDKGVYGFSAAGTGVYAYSGGSHAVWGYTDSPANAGAAVAALRGQAHTEQTFGAFAENLIVGTKGSLGGPRAGVVGHAPDALGAIGVAADAGDAATALSVSGRAAFLTAAEATLAAGKSFVDVSVPGASKAPPAWWLPRRCSTGRASPCSRPSRTPLPATSGSI